MTSYRPNRQNARLAILFTWILLGMTVLSLFSSVLQLDMFLAMRTENVSEAAMTSNSMREIAIGSIYFVVYVIWLVIFLIWFHHARANLQTRLSYSLSCTPGWAVGYYFIPIMNFYRPYQTMKELYVDTRDLFANDGSSEQTLRTDYIGWWWTLWLVTSILSNFVARILLRGEQTLEGLIPLEWMEIVCSALEIALCLVTIIVIRDYSRVEPMLEEMEEVAQPDERE